MGAESIFVSFYEMGGKRVIANQAVCGDNSFPKNGFFSRYYFRLSFYVFFSCFPVISKKKF